MYKRFARCPVPLFQLPTGSGLSPGGAISGSKMTANHLTAAGTGMSKRAE
jgi:hypothetical protein